MLFAVAVSQEAAAAGGDTPIEKIRRVIDHPTSNNEKNKILERKMIELNKVSKWYGNFKVLTDCTTSIAKGDVVVVCGPSGSGKSTMIKTVNGLEPFQEGSIIVDQISVGDPKTNLSLLRTRIGMVFQKQERLSSAEYEPGTLQAMWPSHCKRCGRRFAP